MRNIKYYLHLYLGQQFVLKLKNTPGYSAPMHLEVDALKATYRTDDSHIDPILILRPLSDMTEEEKKESNEIYYRDKIQLLAIMDVAHFELCRYLLSKGFDIFGLIDAGLAIDKTKQP